MSNMENFSADELLKRLKENMEKSDTDKKEPEEPSPILETEKNDTVEAEETVTDPVEEETALAEEVGNVSKAAAVVRKTKKFKFAKRASREIESAVDTDAKESTETDDSMDAATISFDIPATEVIASPKNEIEAVPEAEMAVDDDGDFAASTMVVPDLTELEAPDMEAFEAAMEDEEAQKLEAEEKENGEIDDKLANLMIIMGQEEELRRLVGEDRFQEYLDKFGYTSKSDKTSKAEEKKPVGFAFDGEEYSDPSQTETIVQKYKNEKSRAFMRLAVTGVFALCLLIFENMHLLGVTLPGAFNIADYPALHVFVALQLLVFAAAVSYKEMLSGFAGIASFEFGTNTLAAVTVSFTALCDLLIAFFGAGSDMRLYNFAAAFVLLLCAFHDYLEICKEMDGFEVVSSVKSKFALVRETKLISTERDFGFENTEEKELLLNVKKVGFVNGYFATTNKKTDSNKLTPYFVFGALALSVVLSIISFVNTKNAGTAFAIANLTALMCMPITLFTVTALPSYIASISLKAKGAAMVGDAAAEDYSGASTVIFDDKDIFPSRTVKIRSVKVYGDARIDTVLCDAASIYSKLGGPLCEVLAQAMEDTPISEDVVLGEAEDSGVSATIDSERTVLIGDAIYMQQNDIFPPEDYEDELQLASGNIKIMYMACGDELIAKMYIQYAVDPTFETVLLKLHKNDIRVVIKTMDPNIDNTLLVGKAKPANYPAKIEKRPIEEADAQRSSSVESGVVSSADISSIVSAILCCDKLQHVKFMSALVKAVSVIVSLVIMLIFIIANSSALILSIFVVIYHLFWVLPVFAISKMYLN